MDNSASFDELCFAASQTAAEEVPGSVSRCPIVCITTLLGRYGLLVDEVAAAYHVASTNTEILASSFVFGNPKSSNYLLV